MVMVSVSVHIHGNHAAVLRERAAHMLELHGSVPDVETVGKDIVQALQNAVLADGGTSSISTWQLSAWVLDPRLQMCRSCTSSTPSTPRIFSITAGSCTPRGEPSSRMFSDSLMMSQAVQIIRMPMRIERIGSTCCHPVNWMTHRAQR